MYIAPCLTVVEFRMERGFVSSSDPNDPNPVRGWARNLDRQVGELITLDMENNNLFATDQRISGNNESGYASGGMAAGYFEYGDGGGWF